MRSHCYHKTDNFRLIQSAINRLAIEKRVTPVFIIDEANYLNTAVLNDLKILFNFEMDSRDRAAILLVGQTQLNSILSLNAHEALRQRLVMNYSMEGLSKQEGRTYITGKLNGAGCRQTIFDEATLEAVLNAANGIPRVINRLCDSCLLISHTDGLSTVTAEVAMKAVNDVELG